ncbi:hypothetical protein [Armatimonas rosea]|uniref:Uncharacterized protein n=1 Tax=Armatimonas rosea TaxID=685828 RepID=A0A7W9SML4_ARMRO|nr:hypothetical protein [Armatimonas rosea]MBB6049421.1 hypothetical protein [Armatimonas rosea]
MATVAGGWLGEYHFDSGFPEPCGFEATFSAVGPDGMFHGTILDDGPLGEAVLHHARQVGDEVIFTKVYRQKRRGLLPVRYEGRLLNDGKLLRGKWAIVHSRYGTTGWWEARRTWDALEVGLADEEAEVQQRELVTAR